MERFEIVMIFPIITILLVALFFLYYIKVTRPRAGTAEWISRVVDKPRFEFKRYPLERKDILPLAIITAVFLALALYRLTPFFLGSGWLIPLQSVYWLSWYTHHGPLRDASIVLFHNGALLGSIFGVAILPVFYCFLKNLFGKASVAICGTLLLGFDFTRFYSAYSLPVFFTLLSYYFMYRHITTSEDASFKTKLFPFMMSGLFFGLAVTSGWEALFAGVGLVAIYLIYLIILGRRWEQSVRDSTFGRYLVKTLLFAALSFIIIPAIIYVLSYSIVYSMALGRISIFDLYSHFWGIQGVICSFYMRVEYMQDWGMWSWVGGEMFGNPFVLAGGLLAIITMVTRSIKFNDFKSLFILLGFLSIMLVWILHSRRLFMYHYFTSAIFLVLALTCVIDTMLERKQKYFKQFSYGFVIATGVLFAMFYPVMAGLRVPEWYLRHFIRWFPNCIPWWPL